MSCNISYDLWLLCSISPVSCHTTSARNTNLLASHHGAFVVTGDVGGIVTTWHVPLGRQLSSR